MADNLFKPDFSKKKYTIVIDVFENGHRTRLENIDKDLNVSYYDFIGQLEAAKVSFMIRQREENMEAYDKWQKEYFAKEQQENEQTADLANESKEHHD